MKKVLFSLVTLCVFLTAVPALHATITAELENPKEGTSISGITSISGWAYSDTGAVTLALMVDGDTEGTIQIPCCGPRHDVADMFPGAPLHRGFSVLFNYGLLEVGDHEFVVEINDGQQTVTRSATATVVKPVGAEFLTHLALTNASVALEDDTILLTGVEVVSQQGTAITDLMLSYATSLQSFVIVEAADSTKARLRFLHATSNPFWGEVEVLVNDRVVLSNVAHTEFTEYVQVESGFLTLDVNGRDLRTQISREVRGSLDLTAILAGVVGFFTFGQSPLMLLEDDNMPPATGHAKIRVVHSATRSWFLPVDVYITEAGVPLPQTPTLAHFEPKEVSQFGAGFRPYLEVPAGDYQVRVTYTGDPRTVLMDTGPLPLLDGQIRTVVLVDDEGDDPSFDIVRLEDLN